MIRHLFGAPTFLSNVSGAVESNVVCKSTRWSLLRFWSEPIAERDHSVTCETVLVVSASTYFPCVGADVRGPLVEAAIRNYFFAQVYRWVLRLLHAWKLEFPRVGLFRGHFKYQERHAWRSPPRTWPHACEQLISGRSVHNSKDVWLLVLNLQFTDSSIFWVYLVESMQTMCKKWKTTTA